MLAYTKISVIYLKVYLLQVFWKTVFGLILLPSHHTKNNYIKMYATVCLTNSKLTCKNFILGVFIVFSRGHSFVWVFLRYILLLKIQDQFMIQFSLYLFNLILYMKPTCRILFPSQSLSSYTPLNVINIARRKTYLTRGIQTLSKQMCM